MPNLGGFYIGGSIERVDRGMNLCIAAMNLSSGAAAMKKARSIQGT